MSNAIYKTEKPVNEPELSYSPGSPERRALKDELRRMREKEIEIPLIIGGKEIRTGKLGECIIPHNKDHVLAKYHMAGEKEVQMAISAALSAKREWENMPYEHRASIFLKAAELASESWRYILNASTMLVQSKTFHQAEIDAACELIDFYRFNVSFMIKIYEDQPLSIKGLWNRLDYRPLEGFVLAVTPFNFTAIGSNLSTAPAIVGNVVLWKPASASVYSNYFVMKLLQKAGLPDGVINFLPGSGKDVAAPAMLDTSLAGIHFTGSTGVFQSMWKTVGETIERYKNYPRIIGETGGKDYVFAHSSADIDALVTALVRGAFEYQGQKCSAASRAYIPKSIWSDVRERLIQETSKIEVGDVDDFTNAMGAVIDKKSFDNIKSYIDFATASDEAEIVFGGSCDDSIGYFIEPTVILTTNPRFKTMEEEIFGPVLTVYVYEDSEIDRALELCDDTSPYGLTGAIFAKDRDIIIKAEQMLMHSAGNFYINDKPTGAVVGQQPFGGARASGTNDNAGSWLNLIRWVSPRTIKENLYPQKSVETIYKA